MAALKLKLDDDQREALLAALKGDVNVGELKDPKRQMIVGELVSVLEGHAKAREIKAQKGNKTDEQKRTMLEYQYNAQDVVKLGMGERMEFWAGVSHVKGEGRLMLWTVNPVTGGVGGRFSYPLPLVPALAAYLAEELNERG